MNISSRMTAVDNPDLAHTEFVTGRVCSRFLKPDSPPPSKEEDPLLRLA